MHDSANEIHAVVNGEIYDYDLLRERLSREFGYVFKGHSDSELVVALYKHYGLSLFLTRATARRQHRVAWSNAARRKW